MLVVWPAYAGLKSVMGAYVNTQQQAINVKEALPGIPFMRRVVMFRRIPGKVHYIPDARACACQLMVTPSRADARYRAALPLHILMGRLQHILCE